MAKPEWKPKIINLPFDARPYKAYVIFGDEIRKIRVGEFKDEDDAIKAADLEVIKRNS